ncbi:MAG: hypothetical protein WC521_02760 [Bdellovibrionales bacterium]|jgi:multidrug resistance efflux pump
MDITNKLALGGGAAVAVAFFWLFLANANLKVELAKAQTDIIACRLANDSFIAHVAKQNKAVEQMKADGARREKQMQEAADEAQEKARLFFVAAENIRKTKTRGDDCQAADALFKAYLKDTP